MAPPKCAHSRDRPGAAPILMCRKYGAGDGSDSPSSATMALQSHSWTVSPGAARGLVAGSANTPLLQGWNPPMAVSSSSALASISLLARTPSIRPSRRRIAFRAARTLASVNSQPLGSSLASIAAVLSHVKARSRSALRKPISAPWARSQSLGG